LAEIAAEQRKLRGLRHDAPPRGALQIATVLAVCTPLSWGSMQPRGRQCSRPLTV